MPEYKTPGVYVEELDSGSKPIEGVSTSTAAFVGFSKSGPFNEAILVTSWTDFCSKFCEEENQILVALAEATGKKGSEILTEKRESRMSLNDYARVQLSAIGLGWEKFLGDNQIQPTPAFMDHSYLAYAVKGFFDNGGSRAFIVRVPSKQDLGAHIYKPNSANLSLSAMASIGGLQVKALEAGEGGNEISVEVSKVEGSEDGFTVKISKGTQTETKGSAKEPITPATLAEALKSSKIVQVMNPEVKVRLETKTYELAGGKSARANFPTLPMDRRLADTVADDHEGKEEKKSGLYALDEIDEMLMICVPDLVAPFLADPYMPRSEFEALQTKVLDAQKIVIGYCERRADSVAILDSIPGLNHQEVNRVVTDNLSCDRGHATIYYPWVQVQQTDPRTGDKSRKTIPPCGHMAGVWARTDLARGVHKAPANEAVLGVVDLEFSLSKADQGALNESGINCIRAFPGMGIRVWGARTLATRTNQSWKYLNVRRLFDYLEKSIEKNMNWAVFEPNDQDLWGRLRRNISAFLFTEWKTGKLFGSVPEHAYYVKCDSENNPQEMIDLGRVYVEIGVSPVKPAEFVIIQIGQWSSGGSVSES